MTRHPTDPFILHQCTNIVLVYFYENALMKLYLNATLMYFKAVNIPFNVYIIQEHIQWHCAGEPPLKPAGQTRVRRLFGECFSIFQLLPPSLCCFILMFRCVSHGESMTFMSPATWVNIGRTDPTPACACREWSVPPVHVTCVCESTEPRKLPHSQRSCVGGARDPDVKR